MITPKSNNKAIALERELQALKAISTNGCLTTRCVGLWVYSANSEHVAINKVQQCLKRLELKKEVLKRTSVKGIAAWVLTRKGADRVNAALEGEGYRGYAHHGYDIGMLAWPRQMVVADHLAKKLKEPKTIGAVGAAGIRAGIGGPTLGDCDGFYFTENPSDRSTYTVTGVLAVLNAREGIQRKLKLLLKRNVKIDLVGDPCVVATLRKRTSVD